MAARLLRGIRNEFASWLALVVRAWPESPSGVRLRSLYWRRLLRVPGPLYVGRMADIGPPGLVHIGPNCTVGIDNVLHANNSRGIFLGPGCLLAPEVYVRAANHARSDATQPIAAQGHESALLNFQGCEYSVIIEENVWIGARAILLSGAWVGHDSIIGAGAVVTKQIPPYSVAVGNPARVIRDRREPPPQQ